MPYHIYHSDAIIIDHRDRGESDRDLIVFTRVHGLIRLSAKSVRTGKSRLRYALVPFRIGQLDYLRAKHGWKITSALPKESFPNIHTSREKRVLVAQQFRLLRRMVHGEEKHDAMFEYLRDMLLSVERAQIDHLSLYELILIVRMLHLLGYWGEGDQDILFGDISAEVLKTTALRRKDILPKVNAALRMTHL